MLHWFAAVWAGVVRSTRFSAGAATAAMAKATVAIMVENCMFTVEGLWGVWDGGCLALGIWYWK